MYLYLINCHIKGLLKKSCHIICVKFQLFWKKETFRRICVFLIQKLFSIYFTNCTLISTFSSYIVGLGFFYNSSAVTMNRTLISCVAPLLRYLNPGRITEWATVAIWTPIFQVAMVIILPDAVLNMTSMTSLLDNFDSSTISWSLTPSPVSIGLPRQLGSNSWGEWEAQLWNLRSYINKKLMQKILVQKAKSFQEKILH